MKIVIVRHGDPDYEHDSLTEKGRREAKCLTPRIEKLDFEECYVSPLGRAQETCKIGLGNKKITPVTYDWLKEVPTNVERPHDPGNLTIAWDWLPKDWAFYENFYQYENWMEHPNFERSNVKEVIENIYRNFDKFLADHGYEKMHEGQRESDVVQNCTFVNCNASQERPNCAEEYCNEPEEKINCAEEYCNEPQERPNCAEEYCDEPEEKPNCADINCSVSDNKDTDIISSEKKNDIEKSLRYLQSGRTFKVNKANNDTIVLFCHFGLECVLLSYLLNMSPMILWHGFCARTTSITTVATEERVKGEASFRVIEYGDTSHLYVGGEPNSFSARFCECYDNFDERHN